MVAGHSPFEPELKHLNSTRNSVDRHRPTPIDGITLKLGAWE